MKKIFVDLIVIGVIVLTGMFVYQTYGEEIHHHLFGEQPATMYLGSTPIMVSVADEPAELRQGLSGVDSLKEFEGKLFIFPEEDFYGMWMKDMLFAIDIFWINNDMTIVHIEENVSPDTYPDTFTSTEPARFVLETNAFFASNGNITVGDKVVLPPSALPSDLIDILQ
ncbi:DUF192 domain-containing protein [Candidatus Pacebacteria bacterium]|nr:DUF192 domain-containing protein [Candidatus Paceibacterota bacterium]